MGKDKQVVDIAKVLVTGCAGFIGSNIVAGLLHQGHHVLGIDDMSSGRPDNIRGLDIEFKRGSINDRKLLQSVMRDADYVLHQAAIPSVPYSISNPAESNEVNVVGTLNVLDCAREAGVKRLVFASSSAVYGNSPQLPKREEMPAEPVSPYAAAKYVGEIYCRMFNDMHKLETVSLRYFNIFGPKQDPESQYSAVIPIFVKQLLSGKAPTIFGDGKQTRDFCHVDNVVSANLLAMHAPRSACGRAYNIGSGGRTDLNRLVKYLNRVLGTDIKPLYEKERHGDVKHSTADIRLAKKELGYDPKVDFETGIRKTIEWYKTNA